jgi:glucose-6-phosphate isomerase
MLRYDYSNTSAAITQAELKLYEEKAAAAQKVLMERSGAGNDFLGWIDLPESYDRQEYARIRKAAEKIRSDSEVLLVIGIGGSYLGARAVIEALTPEWGQKHPQIIFCGNSLSYRTMEDIISYIGQKSFSINVISKSGTTTEPAVAFRIFRKLLTERYGEAANARIYATTDRQRGALKSQADAQGWECFVVPDDIGGRYSVLTAVGLLPIAAAGIDTDALMEGAHTARKAAAGQPWESNYALQYAAVRNALREKGYAIEILSNFEPRLHYVAEWWKQLFGESEGKDGKGLFPASVDLTTDLHSMGQYIQDGPRFLIETVLNIETGDDKLVIEADGTDGDGLNFLAGMSVGEINRCAMRGTVIAHRNGGVPVGIFSIKQLDAYHLGELMYTMEYACGVSGYMMGINPFDQPGVENYKNNMFALLGKPGYEALRGKLEEGCSR